MPIDFLQIIGKHILIGVVNNFICYLLKIIQKFWLVKSGGWNPSVVAQISYDIIVEYWRHIYDIMT